MQQMVYFSLDCEASGPVPALYNLLSIGVTVVRREGDHHVLGGSFYVELQPIFPGVIPEAVAVCGLDVERLKRDGVQPREAMTRLTDWVLQEAGPSGSPVFVGHNAVFDWAYIAYYYAHFDLENPFGYKGIDVKSLAMGGLDIAWTETSKENLQKLLALPPQDPACIHRADYDAQYQALILKSILDRRRSAESA
jgi:DNA polymerase III alpha subunit (gram-positive type)